MTLFLALLALIAGLALLTGGGEALVRGATALAARLGVPPAVIGLTVVAAGTSVPELVVCVVAAWQGASDIAVGNVVGSNIFNITIALGIPALISSLPVHGNAVRVEWPAVVAASALTWLLASDGVVSRPDGGVLLVMMVTFLWYTVRAVRRGMTASEASAATAITTEFQAAGPTARPLAIAGMLAGGLVLLVAGGDLLVDGAVGLARIAGLSERVIGLTIVAAGTGAPELATTLVAARRGHTDVAVANMLGSNLFNALAILGLTAVVLPIPVAAETIRSDFAWMLGTALLFFPLVRTHRRIGRIEGTVLATAYVVYVGLLLRG